MGLTDLQWLPSGGSGLCPRWHRVHPLAQPGLWVTTLHPEAPHVPRRPPPKGRRAGRRRLGAPLGRGGRCGRTWASVGDKIFVVSYVVLQYM